MFDPNNPCLFCNSKQSGLAAENEFAYASYDTYPVSEFSEILLIGSGKGVASIKNINELKWKRKSFKFYKKLFNFFKKKLGKIISKDILIKNLSEYDEILLIGSGKGVASIKNINEIKWKRKSFKFYKKLSNFYKNEVNNCSIYR